MEYETRQTKTRRKWGWLWFVAVLGLLLGANAVLYALNRPFVRLEKTDTGISVHFGFPEQKTSAPAESETQIPDRQDYLGTGQTVTVEASRPGVEQIITEGGLSLQEIYETVIPSVVTITTQSYSAASMGTGIVMSHDGYIITNRHVVDEAAGIVVQLTDDTTHDAVLVGADAASDLAVLKIEAQDLRPADFGDSDSLRVGDLAVAIGNPIGAGLRGTMTDGIISGISRDLMVSGRKMTLLQTNAALNNGSSGGPLINCYGQVVGINTVKLTDSYRHSGVEGLGFAIPMNTAKPIVDELIAHGYVSGRGAIGVTVEELPLRARIYFGLPEGAHIKDVDPTSDAYAKGLQAGDIITAFEGTPVRGPSTLGALRDGCAAGDTVTLTVFRNGNYFDLDVVLMDRVADEG